jgi:leucyl aminopeptidase (aminopeptidase T)
VARNESVTVETWTSTLDWANAFVQEIHRIGAHPLLVYRDEATYWKSVEEAGRRPPHTGNPVQRAIIEKSDALIAFLGPNDFAREAALRRSLGAQWSSHLEHWRSAVARADVRTVWMYLGRVNPQVAAGFGLSYAGWRDELIRASLVDPKLMQRWGNALAARLARGREIVVEHPNGTQLTLRLRGRAPIVYSGVVGRSGRPGSPQLPYQAPHLQTPIPAGFVSVAVDEEVAEGEFISNRPGELTELSTDRASGGRWTFSGGRLLRSTFAHGQDGFDAAYALGGPGRDRPAHLSIGLNPEIHRLPWMMDQPLGTVTIGVGGNRHLGGNTASGFSANLHLAGANVSVDGRRIVTAGKIA